MDSPLVQLFFRVSHELARLKSEHDNWKYEHAAIQTCCDELDISHGPGVVFEDPEMIGGRVRIMVLMRAMVQHEYKMWKLQRIKEETVTLIRKEQYERAVAYRKEEEEEAARVAKEEAEGQEEKSRKDGDAEHSEEGTGENDSIPEDDAEASGSDSSTVFIHGNDVRLVDGGCAIVEDVKMVNQVIVELVEGK